MPMNNTVKIAAVCICVPLVTFGVAAAPVAVAAPCDASCGVGGVAGGTGALKSNGKANGGQYVGPSGTTISGTIRTDNPVTAGHENYQDPTAGTGTASGNFTTLPGHGHCTGVVLAAGFCG